MRLRSSVTSICACAVAAAGLLMHTSHAAAQTLTPQTEKLLKALNLEPGILAGLDKELSVPQAWIEGAKSEGIVRVRVTMNDRSFAKLWEVFSARYPGIEYEHVRGTGRQRAVVPLAAFKRGEYVSDVVSSYEVLEKDFRAANALADISELPSYNNMPRELQAEDNSGVSYRRQHWCIAYNTDTVKKDELPKTWDELVSDPRWRDGKVGMAGNVHLWIPPIWGVRGGDWDSTYIQRIFEKLKPQLRKERLAATPQLVGLGEFELAVPAGDFIVRSLEDRGAPVSFHCPAIVPTTTAYVGILRGNPHPNASRLFVNWLLSKEGQIAAHFADAHIPAHKDLQLREFLPYPEEVMGKKTALNNSRVRDKTPAIVAEWGKYWTLSGNVN